MFSCFISITVHYGTHENDKLLDRNNQIGTLLIFIFVLVIFIWILGYTCLCSVFTPGFIQQPVLGVLRNHGISGIEPGRVAGKTGRQLTPATRTP